MENTEKIPLVSVIIPNFNYGRYLEDCISSVINQSYKNIEIIIVDDGSTDDSVSIIEKYDTKIVLVKKDNSGVSDSRNIGLKIATGDYLTFLDADDTLEPTKIHDQMQLMKDSSSELIYCGVNVVDSELNFLRVLRPQYRGECSKLFFKYPTRAIVLLASGSPLISRSLIDKAGYFDTELNTSADWDYMRRLSLFTTIDFVDKPLINYRRHEKSMSVNSLTSYYSDNNLAVNKMLTDYSIWVRSNARIRINFYAWAKFNFGAAKAFLKNGNIIQAINYAINFTRLKVVFCK
jgi:glycosyltransferase involved in cell wall biosynthesis